MSEPLQATRQKLSLLEPEELRRPLQCPVPQEGTNTTEFQSVCKLAGQVFASRSGEKFP